MPPRAKPPVTKLDLFALLPLMFLVEQMSNGVLNWVKAHKNHPLGRAFVDCGNAKDDVNGAGQNDANGKSGKAGRRPSRRETDASEQFYLNDFERLIQFLHDHQRKYETKASGDDLSVLLTSFKKVRGWRNPIMHGRRPDRRVEPGDILRDVASVFGVIAKLLGPSVFDISGGRALILTPDELTRICSGEALVSSYSKSSLRNGQRLQFFRVPEDRSWATEKPRAPFVWPPDGNRHAWVTALPLKGCNIDDETNLEGVRRLAVDALETTGAKTTGLEVRGWSWYAPHDWHDDLFGLPQWVANKGKGEAYAILWR